MILEEWFLQIGAAIVVAAVLAFIMHRLRQPMIIGYILTGILIGPGLLNLNPSPELFGTLSDIGIAFLLFTVGLNLDWKHVKDVGWVSIAAGLGQVLFTSGLGYPLGLLLGFDHLTALYVAVAFTFSSTIIVVKLLSDKQDLERLYGRISVGFLIVQDLIAMFILLVLGALGSGGDASTILTIAFGKWALTVAVMAILSVWVLPRISRYAARSQELLFLFGLAWCFGSAAVLSILGFGLESGALIAGITLAGTIWSKELSSRIRPLRDFFLIIFFVLFGTQLSFSAVELLIKPAALFALFILVANPLILMLVLRLLGYHPRTGFLAGTTVAQISEFSFILISAGVAMDHIASSTLTLATLAGLFTITVSSYLITYNDRIYDFLSPLFRWLEPARFNDMIAKTKRLKPQVIMFGYHRMGEIILPNIQALKKRYLVVDFDPFAIQELRNKKIPTVYGDAGDPDFLSDIYAEGANMVISSIPDEDISQGLTEYLLEHKYKGTIIVTVKTPEEAKRLYKIGATFVIVPSVLSGERFGEMLKKDKTDKKRWTGLSKKIALGTK